MSEQIPWQGALSEGFEGAKVEFDEPRIKQIWRDSVIGDVLGSLLTGGQSEYGRVLKDQRYSPAAKAAYGAGRVIHSFVNDGDRVPWWLLNFPLAQTNVQGQMATTAAGLAPDYATLRSEVANEKGVDRSMVSRSEVDAKWAQREGWSHPDVEVQRGAHHGLPAGLARAVIPLLAASTVVATSGNTDLGNLIEGGRAKGHLAILQDPDDPSKTTNVPAELALRYFLGRSGRLLPWDEFTAERPDVSPDDYRAAIGYQFNKGPLDLGIFRNTGRNLEGEPSFAMLGFEVPLSAASSAGGGMVGAIAGARTADRMIEAHRRKNAIAELTPGTFSMQRPGMRKLVGAILGGAAGAASGNLGSRAINETIIQPTLYPERVREAQLWDQRPPGTQFTAEDLKRMALAREAGAMVAPQVSQQVV
jgi:hypothetical protein